MNGKWKKVKYQNVNEKDFFIECTVLYLYTYKGKILNSVILYFSIIHLFIKNRYYFQRIKFVKNKTVKIKI